MTSDPNRNAVLLPVEVRDDDTLASADWAAGGARGAIFYLAVDDVTGLSPELDVRLQAKSPNGDYFDVPDAEFAQATSAGNQMLTVYPGIVAAPNVAVNHPLPRVFRVVSELNTPAESENEIQTLTLTAGAQGDTFKLTFNAHQSSAAVTIPATDFADVSAAQIKACLLLISDFVGKSADIAVVKAGNEYAITFSNTLGAQDLGPITVTSKVGAADGSVVETNKGVVGESWNGSVTAHLIP